MVVNENTSTSRPFKQEIKDAHRRRRSSIKEIGVEALRRLGSAGASMKHKLSNTKPRPDSNSNLVRTASMDAHDKKPSQHDSKEAHSSKRSSSKIASNTAVAEAAEAVRSSGVHAGIEESKPARRKAQDVEPDEQAGPRIKRQPSLPIGKMNYRF